MDNSSTVSQLTVQVVASLAWILFINQPFTGYFFAPDHARRCDKSVGPLVHSNRSNHSWRFTNLCKIMIDHTWIGGLSPNSSYPILFWTCVRAPMDLRCGLELSFSKAPTGTSQLSRPQLWIHDAMESAWWRVVPRWVGASCLHI
jgi:hypothetical protein